MVPQCFYLIFFVTTAITMTVSDVTLFPDGIFFRSGSQSVRLSNVRPSTIQLGMTSINSTSTGLTVIFADPVQASMVADAEVNDALVFSNVSLQTNVSGYLHVAKETYNACLTDTFAMTACTMKLTAAASLPSVGVVAMEEQDLCAYADEVVKEVLTPKPYVLYPPPLAGTTSLSKSTYLMKLALVNLFAASTGMPVETAFVAPNVIRMAMGAPLSKELVFDSMHESDVEVFDALAVLAKLAKSMLNITMDPAKGSTTVLPFNGTGSIRVPTLRSIIHRAIAEGTTVALQTRMPRSSGIVFDVIVTDFRCRLFNTVCSLPAEDGVEVVNARFGGLGDLGTILDNTAGTHVEQLLTNVTKAAFKVVGGTFGNRIYLPMI